MVNSAKVIDHKGIIKALSDDTIFACDWSRLHQTRFESCRVRGTIVLCETNLKPDIHMATQRNAIPVDGKSLTIAACMCVRRRNATESPTIAGRRRSSDTVRNFQVELCCVVMCMCFSNTTGLTNQSNLSVVTCDSER